LQRKILGGPERCSRAYPLSTGGYMCEQQGSPPPQNGEHMFLPSSSFAIRCAVNLTVIEKVPAYSSAPTAGLYNMILRVRCGAPQRCGPEWCLRGV